MKKARMKKALTHISLESTGVRLNRQGKRWYATFTVEKPNAKEKRIERVVGVDIGIKSTVATSDGREIGQFSEQLKRKLGTEHEEFRRNRNSMLA
ncbi:MAG: hypothetical protein KIT57_20500 [Blastocatellales bacterium]|nr:hypothetical protein [Blastocatellales bacterium]